jgi:hypothetical protein
MVTHLPWNHHTVGISPSWPAPSPQGILDNGLGSYGPLTSAGNNDPFVVKVSSSGTTLGAMRFGTFANEQATAIRVGPQDTIYLVGRAGVEMVCS